MADEQLFLVKDYWDKAAGRFLPPSGTPFATEKYGAEEVQKLKRLGYLKTRQEIEESRNPEAARAMTQAEQLQADLTQAEDKIKALEGQLTKALGGVDTKALDTLKAQLQDAQQQRQAAVDALDEQKRLVVEAEVARDEAQAALAEYEQAVGELLPEALSANARKALLDKGYVGKTVIGLLTDAQLDAVPGIADASIKILREWAGAAEAPADSENAGADA